MEAARAGYETPEEDEAARRHLAIYLAEHDAPCPACGYNLRRLESPTCPECGGPLALAAVKQAAAERARDPFSGGVLFVLIVVATLSGVVGAMLGVVLVASIGVAPWASAFHLATQVLALLAPAAIAWGWGRWSPRLHDAAPERRLAWAAAAVLASLASAGLAVLIW